MLRHPEVYGAEVERTLRPWSTNSVWWLLDGIWAPALTPAASVGLAYGVATVALPLALAAWARTLGRSAALAALFGWWVAFNSPLQWGFFHYCQSLSVAVLLLAGDRALQRDGPRAPLLVSLAGGWLLLFCLHVQTWAFALGACVLQRLVFSADADARTALRGGVGAVGPALPSAGLVALWARGSLFGDGLAPLGGDTIFGGIQFEQPLDALRNFATSALTWSSWTTLDAWLLQVLVVAGVFGLARAVRAADRGAAAVAAVGGAALALYLALPSHIVGQFYVAQRMALWTAMACAVLAAPRPTDPLRWPLAALALAGALTSVGIAHTTFAAFDVEARPAFALMGHIPEGERVVLFSKKMHSEVADGPVYGHILAWYAAEHRGMTSFSFAAFRPNPVVYRAADFPQRSIPGEEYHAWCTALAGRGRTLGYVATRREEPGAYCGAMERYGEDLELVATEADWRLYRVVRPLEASYAPACRCPRFAR